MAKRYPTICREKIPEIVGGIKLESHKTIQLPVNVSASPVMEQFRREMHPSRGNPLVGSMFGGIYRGGYYEALVQSTHTEVWAHNQRTARTIDDIFHRIIRENAGTK